MRNAAAARAKSENGAPERRVECGLCGRTFREDRGQPACEACPLARACRYVRCPHCGFENPVTPAWLDRRVGGSARESSEGPLGRLLARLGRRSRPREGSTHSNDFAGTLAGLEPGAEATVEALADPAGPEGRALVELGLLPGAAIEVLQRYPAWIVRVDHAEIALDDALASRVHVRDTRDAAAGI